MNQVAKSQKRLLEPISTATATSCIICTFYHTCIYIPLCTDLGMVIGL